MAAMCALAVAAQGTARGQQSISVSYGTTASICTPPTKSSSTPPPCFAANSYSWQISNSGRTVTSGPLSLVKQLDAGSVVFFSDMLASKSIPQVLITVYDPAIGGADKHAKTIYTILLENVYVSSIQAVQPLGESSNQNENLTLTFETAQISYYNYGSTGTLLGTTVVNLPAN
jgi:type VI protein secretion system component Hcp